MLLIEFDENKPFVLFENHASSDISSSSLLSKLTLLLVHFPRLRLLWARRPLHAVAIFDEIKRRSRDEPSAATAAAMGVGAAALAAAAGADGTDAPVLDLSAQDVLRCMPGVDATNCRRLMNNVRDLRELTMKSERQLAPLVGLANASALYAFLHRADEPS